MSDNSTVHREAFWLLAHERISTGMSRAVWTSKLFPDCVIKVEDSSGRFQNVVEWETWQRVKTTSYGKWFAPCRWISPAGVVLVMERTRTPAPKDYPERMPVFLSDFKRANYGLIGRRLVCHDYGTHLMLDHGMTPRMRRVEWWDE